jgi:FHS family L-fucose permease-like MFS transporter
LRYLGLVLPAAAALALGVSDAVTGEVMAIVGGAVIPPLMGLLSEKLHSVALSYSVPLLAYVCVVLYSFWGSQRKGLVGEVA